MALALAEFGFRVCCKRKCFFPFKFISLQADTLFLRFKELKLDLELAEAQRSPWKRPLAALRAAGAEQDGGGGSPGGPALVGLFRSSLCFRPGPWEKGSLGSPVTWSCWSRVSVSISVRFGRCFSSSWSRSRGDSCVRGPERVTCRVAGALTKPCHFTNPQARLGLPWHGRVPAGDQGGRDSERLSASPEAASAGGGRAGISARPQGSALGGSPLLPRLFASLTCGSAAGVPIILITFV